MLTNKMLMDLSEQKRKIEDSIITPELKIARLVDDYFKSYPFDIADITKDKNYILQNIKIDEFIKNNKALNSYQKLIEKFKEEKKNLPQEIIETEKQIAQLNNKTLKLTQELNDCKAEIAPLRQTTNLTTAKENNKIKDLESKIQSIMAEMSYIQTMLNPIIYLPEAAQELNKFNPELYIENLKQSLKQEIFVYFEQNIAHYCSDGFESFLSSCLTIKKEIEDKQAEIANIDKQNFSSPNSDNSLVKWCDLKKIELENIEIYIVKAESTAIEAQVKNKCKTLRQSLEDVENKIKKISNSIPSREKQHKEPNGFESIESNKDDGNRYNPSLATIKRYASKEDDEKHDDAEQKLNKIINYLLDMGQLSTQINNNQHTRQANNFMIKGNEEKNKFVAYFRSMDGYPDLINQKKLIENKQAEVMQAISNIEKALDFIKEDYADIKSNIEKENSQYIPLQKKLSELMNKINELQATLVETKKNQAGYWTFLTNILINPTIDLLENDMKGLVKDLDILGGKLHDDQGNKNLEKNKEKLRVLEKRSISIIKNLDMYGYEKNIQQIDQSISLCKRKIVTSEKTILGQKETLENEKTEILETSASKKKNLITEEILRADIIEPIITIIRNFCDFYTNQKKKSLNLEERAFLLRVIQLLQSNQDKRIEKTIQEQLSNNIADLGKVIRGKKTQQLIRTIGAGIFGGGSIGGGISVLLLGTAISPVGIVAILIGVLSAIYAIAGLKPSKALIDLEKKLKKHVDRFPVLSTNKHTLFQTQTQTKTPKDEVLSPMIRGRT